VCVKQRRSMMTAVASVATEKATVQMIDVAAEPKYLNYNLKTFLQQFYLWDRNV